jgi:predicted hotdog family 3-hydroxylacyl-ACP dehydratase
MSDYSSPVDVSDFIPHLSPVKMVDAILEWDDENKSSVISACVLDDSPFVNSQGVVDNECFLEIIAQAAAAQHGFNLFRNNKPEEQGFIAGVNFLNVLDSISLNLPLIVKVECGTEISSLSVVNGKVFSDDGKIKAEAAITVWHGNFN